MSSATTTRTSQVPLPPASEDTRREALATLMARSALAGHTCTLTADGAIVLGRWGHTAVHPTIEAANLWLDRVAGPVPKKKTTGPTLERRPADETPRERGDLETTASTQSTAGTATADQRFRILQALARGPKTSYELRHIGCYQASARIFELRRAGHDITAKRVTVIDAEGYSHARVALYELIAAPAGKAVT